MNIIPTFSSPRVEPRCPVDQIPINKDDVCKTSESMFTETSCNVISFLLFPEKNVEYIYEVNAVVSKGIINLYSSVLVSYSKNWFIWKSLKKEIT